MTSQLSYPETGATTRPGEPLPSGYQHLHHRVLIGHGRDVLERAGDAVTTWRMHRAAGIRVRADSDRAAPGVAVECAIGVGPLRVAAPCEVVWSTYESDRIGFAYGTRTGHPECGEESFIVQMGPDLAVWFTVTAFSVPGRWYTRLAGPLVPHVQRRYARRYGRAVRRLAERG
ncbi:DUF1990 domain-containing protein [Kitasatospora sp. MAP5-34]|uniref:DUF1990 family protein n=1 Tax=Kitasatospora sp. MAP5-34 TaxID=3035102 RepID=UPI002473ED54|nr:DUF1990 domain-containing protein [Kitasatospora sp. MAP5-34]MDH6576116.1 uncharacterized protein (UPF0548 family) [Kitasatospora sp. MAP5-34]